MLLFQKHLCECVCAALTPVCSAFQKWQGLVTPPERFSTSQPRKDFLTSNKILTYPLCLSTNKTDMGGRRKETTHKMETELLRSPFPALPCVTCMPAAGRRCGWSRAQLVQVSGSQGVSAFCSSGFRWQVASRCHPRDSGLRSQHSPVSLSFTHKCAGMSVLPQHLFLSWCKCLRSVLDPFCSLRVRREHPNSRAV